MSVEDGASRCSNTIDALSNIEPREFEASLDDTKTKQKQCAYPVNPHKNTIHFLAIFMDYKHLC